MLLLDIQIVFMWLHCVDFVITTRGPDPLASLRMSEASSNLAGRHFTKGVNRIPRSCASVGMGSTWLSSNRSTEGTGSLGPSQPSY
jgi:hypothetical protein